MKHRLLIGLVVLVALGLTGGTILAQPTAGPDFQAMLSRFDTLMTMDQPGLDFWAIYTFEKEEPGQGKTSQDALVLRRDRDGSYLIVMLKPASNKGRAYLNADGALWFYDPAAGNSVKVDPKNRFQSLSVRNSDFNRPSLSHDYTVVSGSRARLGSFDCWVLNLKARRNDLSFPMMRVWISDDGLLRKTEDYSASGAIQRQRGFPEYLKVGNRYIPKTIVIQDPNKYKDVAGVRQYEQTKIEVRNPKLQALPDLFFSTGFLPTLNSRDLMKTLDIEVL